MAAPRYDSLVRSILKSAAPERFNFVQVLRETEDPEAVKAHDHMMVGDRVCDKATGRCGVVDAVRKEDGRPDGVLLVMWDDGGSGVVNRFDVRFA
jgi:hypothetical protein